MCIRDRVGTVAIGDDVEIGANSTIDRSRFGRTEVGEGTKIDNLVQVGHNVVIGKHCLLCAQVGISGSCKFGKYVILAGQAGFAGHLKIGDRVTVSAQSGVMNDIPDGEKWPVSYTHLPFQSLERTRISLSRSHFSQ